MALILHRQNITLIKRPEIHLAQTRHSLLFHVHTIDGIHSSHGGLVVRNNNKLRLSGKFLDDLVELLDVGIIQWSIDLIEYAEGSRLHEIERKQKRNRGQR